ncbi:class I lanthipeptide [Neolewinella agarilytica]|uniref:Uncharacterized protein n=1 Tax=Neolewinella agarilytica TaxID=478744 RepID=A0A1H9KD88_9BACT|nr:class I lanthipeptide [Neolewinella agarilytica]SEQ97018.1 hypothetical protein SAMN05444359_12053 [Neolewinella agarilytica]
MKKKLQLKKETLVRLREQQLAATQGGNALAESRGVNSADELAVAFASCCRKTCNDPKEEEIGID